MLEFYRKFPGSIPFVKKNNLFPFIKDKLEVRTKMTLERAVERVNLYTDYSEFRKKEVTAYTYLRKRGLLSKYTKTLYRKGNLLKRAIYVFEFSTHAAYIGLSKDPKNRRKQHLQQEKSAVYQHIKNHNCTYEFKVISDYLNAIDAAALEKETIKQYHNHGWSIINKVDGGSLGFSPVRKYSKEYIISRAKQYKNASEFREKENALYHYAEKHNELEIISLYYKNGNKRRGKISYDFIFEIAKKFHSKYKFYVSDYKNYRYAKKRGWIEQIEKALLKDGTWEKGKVTNMWKKATD